MTASRLGKMPTTSVRPRSSLFSRSWAPHMTKATPSTTTSYTTCLDVTHIDTGQRPGTTTADANRINYLEREVKELRRANEIRATFGSQRGVSQVGDLTYLPTGNGRQYLAIIIDPVIRIVVGWQMVDYMRTALVTEALAMAITHGHARPGAGSHSDRGCQGNTPRRSFPYSASGTTFARLLGAPGVCSDNAVAESFFASLKKRRTTAIASPGPRTLRRSPLHNQIPKELSKILDTSDTRHACDARIVRRFQS